MRKISIVVPFTPTSDLQLLLEHLARLDFPLDEIEVLIAEGLSPSRQRNVAARLAAGEFLYFLDDDSYVMPSAITEALTFFQDPEVIGIGGPAVTYSDGSFLEQSFGDVVGAFLGAFITRSRNKPVGVARRVSGEELIACNLMLRKREFFAADGLSDLLYPGEEHELMKRLRRAGAAFMYNPRMVVNRTRRKTFGAFALQSARYGFGRAKHVLKGFHPRDAFFFVPLLFLMYLLVLPFFQGRNTHHELVLVPIAAYTMLALVSSAHIAVARRDIRRIPLLIFSFFVLHLSYGVGFGSGLINQLSRKPRKGRRSTTVKVTRLCFSPERGWQVDAVSKVTLEASERESPVWMRLTESCTAR